MTEKELAALRRRSNGVRKTITYSEPLVLKPTTPKKRVLTEFIPYESDEQKVVVSWAFEARIKWPELELLYAVPNGALLGGRNRFAQVKNLKAQGMQVGVPDLVLPVARRGYHGWYGEMKRLKGGKLNDPDQAWWREHLTAQGFCVDLCKGSKYAIGRLAWYLGKD